VLTVKGRVCKEGEGAGAKHFSRPRVFAVDGVRFVRGTARYRTWCEVEHRPLGWASRSLQREFEEVIMVEVLIEEMYGSD
jgi:hypothetical protein